MRYRGWYVTVTCALPIRYCGWYVAVTVALPWPVSLHVSVGVIAGIVVITCAAENGGDVPLFYESSQYLKMVILILSSLEWPLESQIPSLVGLAFLTRGALKDAL